jgi:diguanylate cyclase (GGDEF)-like protein
MSKQTHSSGNLNIVQEELRGFSRSFAELEWLMLILSLLYLFVPGASINDRSGVIQTMLGFACFVIVFRYTNFHRMESRWKLAVETWGMIIFISWMLWHTGMVTSPLINLYLLLIIACALTLGKLVTFMELALISCWYLYMAYTSYGDDVFSLKTFSSLMSTFSPFVLVGYLTTMLSSDIHYAKQKIITASETDELTKLPNMRAFNELLQNENARFKRYNKPFSIMMIDIDELKVVNDRFGHETGNQLIIMAANSIKGRTRNADVLARYGGDEFIMLLPETDAEQLRELADRIRTAVENAAFDEQGERIATTVSIGLASCPADAVSPKDLINKADAALYRSKRGGRNRITLWRHDPEAIAQHA